MEMPIFLYLCRPILMDDEADDTPTEGASECDESCKEGNKY